MKPTKDNRTLTRDELSAALEFEELLLLAHAYDKLITVSTLLVFAHIASHQGCAAADLCKELKLAQPAVVRHLQRLGRGSPGSKNVGRGLGLIRHEDDPKDTRRRLYFLTELGVRFIERVSTRMPKQTLVPNVDFTPKNEGKRT